MKNRILTNEELDAVLGGGGFVEPTICYTIPGNSGCKTISYKILGETVYEQICWSNPPQTVCS
jgi:hypothetical protein